MTTEPNFTAGQEPEGKVGAVIAWALYLLSIPSANALVLVGLVVAYVTRNTAVGVARQHIDAQIALFWSVFWWTIAAWAAIIVSAVASVFLIGIPFLMLAVLGWFVISIWFTVKSALGLINLLQNKPI